MEIYYETHGSGEPLLLIAGYGHHSLVWSHLLEELSKQFQVILFDNRGMGRTHIPAPPYTMQQMADDAASLLEKLGIEKAHIVGHSMGGCIAQELCIYHPEKVMSCTLYSTLPYLPKASELVMRATMEMFATQVDPIITGKHIMAWAFGSTFLAIEDVEEQLMQNILDNPYPIEAEGIAGQYAALSQFDSRDRLHKITAPCLIIAGKEDISSPLYTAEILQKGIPHSRLEVLENIGHTCHTENPALFLDTLISFVGDTAAI